MQVIYDVINMHEKFQVTSVCHSFTINEEKISPCPGFELGTMVWYARILATEPTDLHSIQACESYLNIINEIFYTLKLICLCYSWFYY